MMKFNSSRRMTLCLIFTWISLVCSAQAQWFTEKLERAAQVVERTPTRSILAVGWSLGDQAELAERRAEILEFLDSLPEEARQAIKTAQEDLGVSLPSLLESLSGNGYFTAAANPSKPEFPHLTLAFELQKPEDFENWLNQFIKEDAGTAISASDKLTVWDMTKGGGPYFARTEGWFFASSSAEEFNNQLAAARGESRLAQDATLQKAINSVDTSNGNVCLFVHGRSLFQAIDNVVEGSGMDVPTELKCWEYGIASVDFEARQTEGLLAWENGENNFFKALRTPGKVDLSLAQLLPQNMSTMIMVDVDWGVKSLEGLAEASPELGMFINMALQYAKQSGDPTEAFTGRMAFATDALDVLGPGTMGNLGRASDEAGLAGCSSNIRNISTGLEMYSTDWGGRYPGNLEQLVPDYLKYIPECPVADQNTYAENFQTGLSAPGNEQSQFDDYYYFDCHGNHHANTFPNHPRYDAITGLILGASNQPGLKEKESIEPTTVIVAEVRDVESAHKMLLGIEEPKLSKLDACKSNQKNIGVAMEMYSTDWSGRYPSDFGSLTPDYLRNIPECPAATRDTYTLSLETGPKANGNTEGFEDFYYFHCSGHHHPELQANYPRYNGIVGLDVGTVDESVRVAETEAENKSTAPTEPTKYDAGDALVVLDPARKVVLISFGPNSEKLVTQSRTDSMPQNILDALNWGNDQAILVSFSNLDGLYNYFLRYFNELELEYAVNGMTLLKSWLGQLQDVQMIAATPEGLRFRSRGYNSAPGSGATVFAGSAILIPNMVKARAQGQLTACKSNLKNIGTALEMYSTDYSGVYPEELGQLTPEYLRTMPSCPKAQEDTYSASYRWEKSDTDDVWDNKFWIHCHGHNHAELDLPENNPAYNNQTGIE